MQPIKGGKLQIAAQDFGNMLESANDYSRKARSARSRTIEIKSHSGDVFAYNSGETSFARFSAVGIKANPITDSAHKQEILAVEIETLTDAHIVDGRFAILAEPSVQHSVVKAWTSGTLLATVNVSDASDRGIQVTSGGIVSSVTAVHGALLTSSGTGSQLCLVTIERPGGSVLRYGAAEDDWVDDGTDTDNGCYVMVTPCENIFGDSFSGSTQDSVKIYLPRSGRREDPNVRSGNVIAYLEAGTEPGEGSGAEPQVIGVCVTDVLDGKCGETLKLIDKTATTPAGWEELGDANGRTVSFNTDPDLTGETGGEDTANIDDVEHEDLDCSAITAHPLSGVTTETGGPNTITHTGTLGHERLDHSGTLSHDSVALQDHTHGLYTDMRQASGLQMESTAIQSATKGIEGSAPTHTHAAHNVYGSISSHNPAAHSGSELGDHTLSDLQHMHTLSYGTTLDHAGTLTPAHKEYTLNKWQQFYTVKLIRRKD